LDTGRAAVVQIMTYKKATIMMRMKRTMMYQMTTKYTLIMPQGIRIKTAVAVGYRGTVNRC
jgi:hypothetical protein